MCGREFDLESQGPHGGPALLAILGTATFQGILEVGLRDQEESGPEERMTRQR